MAAALWVLFRLLTFKTHGCCVTTYYRRGIEIDRTQLAIAEGLGELLQYSFLV